MIWSDPRPADEKIKAFYSTEYRKEYKGITRPKKKHVYRDAKEAIKRYNFFKEILRDDGCLLDIGAGNGVFVYVLRKLGYKAQGVEPDEGHARYAREELQVPVTTGFAQEVNSKESFNVIFLHHVLEHLTDPLAELKNIWSIIKNAGYLVIEVPNAEDVKQDPKNRYHKAHLYTFNPESLVALGKKAGFEVFKKSIAPFNGNISVIFQKSDEIASGCDDLGENYNKIKKVLSRHTTIHHFSTFVPYKKAFVNLFSAVCEQFGLRKSSCSNDKAIIDAVITIELQQKLKSA